MNQLPWKCAITVSFNCTHIFKRFIKLFGVKYRIWWIWYQPVMSSIQNTLLGGEDFGRNLYCLKVSIFGVYLIRIFPHLDWIFKSKGFCKMQTQPTRGVLRKRCSENMQQIYRRKPMPKCENEKSPSKQIPMKFLFPQIR